MSKGLQALTDREKETLRLLLGGHDAKSIARDLGLSVHTVHERLRDARRKLEVPSSREAARLLWEAEQRGPNPLVDKQFGVAGEGQSVSKNGQPDRPVGAGHSLAWLGGGMLVMSLIVATVVLSSLLQGSGASDTQAPELRSVATSQGLVDSAGESAAREWVALLDRQRWEESWRAAGALMKSQTAERWVAIVQPVRQPLGAVSSRVLQSATKADSLPGAPAGEYEILQFRTSFERMSDATETVVLARESSGWKVAGYFIR